MSFNGIKIEVFQFKKMNVLWKNILGMSFEKIQFNFRINKFKRSDQATSISWDLHVDIYLEPWLYCIAYL